MRTCLLLNPHAGSADTADPVRAAAATFDDLTLVEADGPEGMRGEAARAVRYGFDVVAAVGGDGTIHEVVNGLMEAGGSADTRPALAVIPLGTGNDLARTLALPLDDPEAALALVRVGERRALDLIRVRAPDKERWAVNVCAGGFSGQVDEILTDELKQSWGPLAYLVGAAKALPDLTGYDTRLAWDDGPPERVEAFNVVVANGRTAAGGKPAAPKANPEDGLLDVVVVRRQSAFDIMKLAALVFAGDYLSSDRVVHRRVRRLTVTSRPGMWFNVDGELFANEPVTFEAVPGALRVVVGPTYQAEPT